MYKTDRQVESAGIENAGKETTGVDPAAPEDNLLSMEEILRGGDEPFTRLEIPALSKGGKPGVVYIRQPPAGSVIDFGEMKEGSAQRKAAQWELVGRAMVTKDGTPLFPEGKRDRVKNMPAPAFLTVLKAVTSGLAGEDEATVKND